MRELPTGFTPEFAQQISGAHLLNFVIARVFQNNAKYII
jgi:hypothetical protein